jgi:RNA polymerase II subunit A small phosphatase-like protein
MVVKSIQQLIDETVTTTPHPPSSSTQATSTAQNTASTEDSEAPVLSNLQNEKDFLEAEEAPVVPKKNRGLLHVPSRSSSHKIQRVEGKHSWSAAEWECDKQ